MPETLFKPSAEEKINSDIRFAIFRTRFNVHGEYTNALESSLSKNGANLYGLVDRIKSDSHYLAQIKKFPRSIFSSANAKMVVGSIEEQKLTHVFTHLEAKDKRNPHAVSLNFFKDKKNHYHIIFINKNSNLGAEQVIWLYLHNSQFKLINRIVDAAQTEDLEQLLEALISVSINPNVINIQSPSLPKAKRGNCTIITLKNMKRVAYYLDIIKSVELNTHFDKTKPTSIKFDPWKLHPELEIQWKESNYMDAWHDALVFGMFMQNHGKVASLKTFMYQAMHNHFLKERFQKLDSPKEEQKLLVELPIIKNYFICCLRERLFESALLLAINFAKSEFTNVAKKSLFAYLCLEINKIQANLLLDKDLESLLVQGVIDSIIANKFQPAYLQLYVLIQLMPECVNEIKFLINSKGDFKNRKEFLNFVAEKSKEKVYVDSQRILQQFDVDVKYVPKPINKLNLDSRFLLS